MSKHTKPKWSKSLDHYAYSAETLDDYRRQINALDDGRLNEHAHEVGIVPCKPLDSLKKHLEARFEAYLTLRGPLVIRPAPERKPRVEPAPMESVEPIAVVPSTSIEEASSPSPERIRPVAIWRVLLNEMLDQGVTYDKVYPTEDLEKALGMTRDQPQFSFAVSHIRRELMGEGFYLTSRGMKGEQYVVLPANRNADVMEAFSRRASDMLTSGIVLGSNTKCDTLNAEEKRRHDSTLEKLAHKSVLMRKSEQVWERVEGDKKLNLVFESAV